jgi:hypothetical protein
MSHAIATCVAKELISKKNPCTARRYKDSLDDVIDNSIKLSLSGGQTHNCSYPGCSLSKYQRILGFLNSLNSSLYNN